MWVLQSVVGKLWATIIGLVAFVLVVLSLLLGQFFDRYYVNQTEANLLSLAERLSYIVASANSIDVDHAIMTSGVIMEGFGTRLIVVGSDHHRIGGSLKDPSLPEIPLNALFKNSTLDQVFEGKTATYRGVFPIQANAGKGEKAVEFIAVAAPLKENDQVTGAVVLYQSMEVLNETLNGLKHLIFYAAIVAAIMTTVFAFFLSSRVSQPLISMKRAAVRISRGEFNVEVPIRTHDEIGELAATFNRMSHQLRQSIQTVSEEKEQLSGILRSMTDIVITTDINGYILVTNPTADNWLRMNYSRVKDNSFYEIPLVLRQLFDHVVKEQEAVSQDVTTDGRTWSVTMGPLYRESQVRGVVTVMRDVTEERKLDKLRKDFVANVSHELRTPLSMLQGYSEAIVDDIAKTDEEKKEMAQIIYDESVRMTRLVNELLDLAKMETGQMEIHYEPIMLESLVTRVVRKFAAVGKEKGVQLLWQAPGKVTVEADEDKLEQVLTNLIDNAIRHTPTGKRIIISFEEMSNSVQIKVTDEGDGIPEEDLPFIFERFYKADKARTRGRSGTGLGLAIVKNIVEAHQGTISVSSQIGRGTQFTVILPKKAGRLKAKSGENDKKL